MWKCTNIISVPKQYKTNFPRAILKYLSKMLEKLIYIQMMQHLYDNDLLSQKQSQLY